MTLDLTAIFIAGFAIGCCATFILVTLVSARRRSPDSTIDDARRRLEQWRRDDARWRLEQWRRDNPDIVAGTHRPANGEPTELDQ